MLLTEDVRAQVKDAFKSLKNPVRLAVFHQALADPESEQVRRLVEEVAALDPLLSVEPFNFVLDKEKVADLHIARTPAIALLTPEKDARIRMYGPPSGYEFGTLMDAIVDVSEGESRLSDPTKEALRALTAPAHIQVFSTPT